MEGRLELSPRRITVKSAEAEGVEILYRLPDGLAAPAHVPGRATASVRDLSGPQGADRLVTVRDPQGLTFLELWRRSPDPIQVESGDLLIEQRAVQADASNPQGVYVAAPVFISAGEKQQEIPLGRAVRVETGRQALNVYVETSHLFAVPEDVDHGGRYYILRVWITGAKPAGRE